MSLWIIYKIYVLRLASFFIYFLFMHSLHCSKSESSDIGRISGRISFSTCLSILPLEIWPKRQCHNFDNASWALLCHHFQSNTLWPALSAKWHMSLRSQWTDSLFYRGTRWPCHILGLSPQLQVQSCSLSQPIISCWQWPTFYAQKSYDIF